MAHEAMTAEMRHCIDECNACRDLCVECVSHCLELGGEHADAGHIRAMLDCAELCQASAVFMLRSSDLHADVCDVCAEACAECAASCDSLGDDEMMQRCADQCRRCEATCREMAGANAAS